MLLCIQTKASLGRKQEQSPRLGEGEKHAIAGRGWDRRNILVKTQRCSGYLDGCSHLPFHPPSIFKVWKP